LCGNVWIVSQKYWEVAKRFGRRTGDPMNEQNQSCALLPSRSFPSNRFALKLREVSTPTHQPGFQVSQRTHAHSPIKL
jgi:hypothetical protein